MAWTLADLLPSAWQSNKPNPQQLGSGSAAQAGQQLSGRAYQLYVQEMQAMGQQPLPPEQWAQSQGR